MVMCGEWDQKDARCVPGALTLPLCPGPQQPILDGTASSLRRLASPACVQRPPTS